MALPLAAIALLQSVGAVGGMFGAYNSAVSDRAGLRHQAAIDRINAGIADLGARSEMEQGQYQVARLTRDAGNIKSRQRVAMAANGVDLTEGSAAEVLASTDVLKEIDKSQIEANAIRSAWGYRTEALNLRSRAAMADTTADNISPTTAAFTSLLGSAGSVAQGWYNYAQARG